MERLSSLRQKTGKTTGEIVSMIPDSKYFIIPEIFKSVAKGGKNAVTCPTKEKSAGCDEKSAAKKNPPVAGFSEHRGNQTRAIFDACLPFAP
jgi:hypothetical protein